MAPITRSQEVRSQSDEFGKVSPDGQAEIPMLRSKSELSSQPNREELLWAEPDWMSPRLVEDVVEEGKRNGLDEETTLKIFRNNKYILKWTVEELEFKAFSVPLDLSGVKFMKD